jgi:anti-anti-sigma factor
MTIAIATRQGNDTFDCSGAQIRAHCRHLATVVTIRGEIDAVNVGAVGEYIRRFVLASNPVVLDMSGVNPCAAAGISLLSAFDDECRAAGVEWTLVASPAVFEVLDEGCEDDDAMFPVTRSVSEALRDLANAIVIRRQLVLPLLKKSA